MTVPVEMHTENPDGVAIYAISADSASGHRHPGATLRAAASARRQLILRIRCASGLLVCVSLLAALVRAGHAAQDSPPQRFRAGVDLITIDVAAVDAKGRPVEDLKPGDFVVKVDGKQRPTASAELIKVDRGKPAPARPSELISTNDAPQNARRIVVAIDQTLITPGALAPLQRTASEFIGRLTPDDYAGFVAFPEPGPRVDFTTDKARVRKALEGIIGQPARIFSGDFNIGLSEAFTITGAEGLQASSVDPADHEADA